MNRRNFLSLAGLSVPSLLKAQYGATNVKAKNIIYIFLNGGISAQETFNSLEFAPAEYKGPFGTIFTKTDGLNFSDRLPLLAQESDKFCVINSMTHGQAAHELGTNYMFTGYKPSPAIQYASLGSILSHELGEQENLPPYVTVPSTPNEFANAGFLSSKYGPFSLGSDPASPNFQVKDLNHPYIDRLDRKKSLLETIDSKFKKENESDNIKAMDSFYEQAFRLMSSDKAKESFNIDKESPQTRELYGTGQAGSRFLMARRLVEAGVRIVKVNFGSWDNHDNIERAMIPQLAEFDKALSALFVDLKQRGLLEETLVIVTSEFGRTPKINNTLGRDHWPKNFSTVIGGAGIKNNTVFGKTNEIASEVEENPVAPEDLFATIFKLVGINNSKELMTTDLRPIQISKGRIISEILA